MVRYNFVRNIRVFSHTNYCNFAGSKTKYFITTGTLLYWGSLYRGSTLLGFFKSKIKLEQSIFLCSFSRNASKGFSLSGLTTMATAESYLNCKRK